MSAKNPFYEPPLSVSLNRSFSDGDDIEGIEKANTTVNSPEYLGKVVGLRQLGVIAAGLILIFMALLGRAFFIQVISGPFYQQLAEGNRVRQKPLPAPRGLIEDRYGKPLSKNIPRFSLAFVPRDIPRDETTRFKLFQDVSQATNIPIETIISAWNELPPARRASIEPYIISSDISLSDGPRLHILESSWTGIELLTTALRTYPEIIGSSDSLSHVLGYVGRVTEQDLESEINGRYYAPWESIGKNGLELIYEPILRGQHGQKEIEVNALGQEQGMVAEHDPVSGNNIRLTIDAELQKISEESLRRNLARANAKRGVALVIDSTDGGVLAMVNLPSFDANKFNAGQTSRDYKALEDDPNHPLFQRSIQGVYPSGSTIKPVIAAAALAEGVITSKTHYLSTGGFYVGQSFFPDWKAGGHGLTDIKRAIAESINTFFYIIGGGYNDYPGLGIERIAKYFRMFGLGEKSGIDLPGEASGLVPTPEWKKETKGEKWYIGDTYHVAIGQGDILVTPLQVANYTASIANGGTLYRPYLRRETITPNGVTIDRQQKEAIANNIIDDATLEIVREGMRQTVVSGSARSLGALNIDVAGKTGTAEIGGDRKNLAWFTGFAPYHAPQIVVTVLLEEAGDGSAYATPVAKDIFEWWAENRSDNKDGL